MWALIEHVFNNRTSIMVFILMIASVGILAVLLVAQLKKDSFDLRFLVVDDVTNKPSIHKAGQGVALIVSTWGFVYQIVHGQFTDTYLLVYMGWAGIEAMNRFAQSRNTGSYPSSGGGYQPPYNNPSCPPPSRPIPTPIPHDRFADDDMPVTRDDHPIVKNSDRPLK